MAHSVLWRETVGNAREQTNAATRRFTNSRATRCNQEDRIYFPSRNVSWYFYRGAKTNGDIRCFRGAVARVTTTSGAILNAAVVQSTLAHACGLRRVSFEPRNPQHHPYRCHRDRPQSSG